MQITYRKPSLDEAGAFAALHVQCWREAYSAILPPALVASFSAAKRLWVWQARLADAKLFVMGAYADGVPCGFVMSGPANEQFIEDQDGHLWALYIAASQHRLGIGRALMGHAARDWLSRGGKSMTIGVLAENKPARAFYERLGAVKAREGHYVWDGYPLADCIYLLESLAKIAKD
ncbi:MAG: GNAT family N-acetyltransferase [Alphaproteobacteria bacterium]|nr:GNAT family N-acetyltransferase [Alphaproteobacteria bacterium]